MPLDLDASAKILVDARRNGVRLDAIPSDLKPTRLSDAYAVQARAAQLWGDRIVGWKVGATTRDIQQLFGVTEPIYGPVFASDVFQSPARVTGAAYGHRLLESELAVRFGLNLPVRIAAYSRHEIEDAIDAVIPAFEIISPRFPKLTVDDIPQLVADFGGNGGAVLGQPITDWRDRDIGGGLDVTLALGGVARQSGTGALVLGHPLNVVEWLVGALARDGIGLAAGQFVLTGTMTGLHAPARGETAHARFGDLGGVEVVFA